MACLTQENVAEIIAWLATIAAKVAITRTGQKRLSVFSQHSETRSQKEAPNVVTPTRLKKRKRKIKCFYSSKYNLVQNHKIFFLQNQGISADMQLGPCKPREDMGKQQN